jgi:hypothetical protein
MPQDTKKCQHGNKFSGFIKLRDLWTNEKLTSQKGGKQSVNCLITYVLILLSKSLKLAY